LRAGYTLSSESLIAERSAGSERPRNERDGPTGGDRGARRFRVRPRAIVAEVLEAREWLTCDVRTRGFDAIAHARQLHPSCASPIRPASSVSF
jgi:hypothetical protein